MASRVQVLRTQARSATLKRMLANLRSRLLPGGLLIVCRTNAAGINNATVFTLGPDGRFDVLFVDRSKPAAR